MSKDVIVIAADGGYIPHAKAAMVNCVRQGGWTGDFCLITANDCNAQNIERQRISLFRVPATRHALKFYLFSENFRGWDRVLYMDCDCLVQGNLSTLFDDLTPMLPAILCDGTQDTPMLDDWKAFCIAAGENPDDHIGTFTRLEQRFPIVRNRIFASDLVFFSPKAVATDTVGKILSVQEEFKEINPDGYDQQVTGLVIYDQIRWLPKDYFSWFAFDEPCNRVPSETNGWSGNEQPVILHYWHTMAPWVVKEAIEPRPLGYYNTRIARVCHELYRENLSLFEETFPR